MIGILSKLFIKNSEDVLNPRVRKAYGTLTGTVGIINNIFLFLVKFFAGIITGAISITADAFNNLSDAGSSIITLIGFRMAGKPADSHHPYGHGRIEYLTGLVIAIVIIVMGLELLKSSVLKIIHPEPIEFSLISAGILVLSILIKLWMTHYNRYLSKKLESSAMAATAADSFNDSIATTAVFICLIICHFTDINIDGWAGAVVALFVLWSGYQTAMETLQPILGEAPDESFVTELQKRILSYDEIKGIHDMIVHDYGPGRVMVSLHAEIPSNMDIVEAHEVIDKAETDIKKNMGCEICIHMDPIATEDKKTNRLKKEMLNIAKSVDERIDIHDFRISEDNNITKMVFDVAAPFELKLSDEDIINQIVSKTDEAGHKFNIIIEDVDRR